METIEGFLNFVYFINFWTREQAQSHDCKHAERTTNVINRQYMLPSPSTKQMVSNKCHKHYARSIKVMLREATILTAWKKYMYVLAIPLNVIKYNFFSLQLDLFTYSLKIALTFSNLLHIIMQEWIVEGYSGEGNITLSMRSVTNQPVEFFYRHLPLIQTGWYFSIGYSYWLVTLGLPTLGTV